MSDETNGDKILIKFEIHVPVGAGQSPVIVQPVTAHPPSPPPAPAVEHPAGVGKVGILSITQPGPTARVRVLTTGSTNGVVCVRGTTDTDALNRIPLEVQCEIIDCTSPIPAVPDGGAMHAIKDDGSSYLNWHIFDLPNAKCSWSGTGTNLPYNELVVWRKFEGELFWTIEVKSFRGLCSNHTDCEVSAPGSPAVAHVLDTVPQALQLLAAGFGGALKALNGTWLLPHFPKVAAGILSWMCGGDGNATPRVELSGKNCGCEPVELHLACAGRKLTYAITREAFNPLGTNRFVLRVDQRLPYDSQLPTELVVSPAQARA